MWNPYWKAYQEIIEWKSFLRPRNNFKSQKLLFTMLNIQQERRNFSRKLFSVKIFYNFLLFYASTVAGTKKVW